MNAKYWTVRALIVNNVGQSTAGCNSVVVIISLAILFLWPSSFEGLTTLWTIPFQFLWSTVECNRLSPASPFPDIAVFCLCQGDVQTFQSHFRSEDSTNLRFCGPQPDISWSCKTMNIGLVCCTVCLAYPCPPSHSASRLYYLEIKAHMWLVSPRERTIRTRTDTIRYEYSSITQLSIPIRVLLALVSQPCTYIIIPGRSFRERSYFAQWVAHFIQG